MTITKVIKDLIETNTYNEIVSNIGNTQPVTINSIVFANTTFANITNTSMLSTGGYFKLYGNNYQSGANVYLDRYLAGNTQYISSNELRVTFSSIPPKTYSLFLYNPDGSNAIKYNSFLVQGNNTIGYVTAGTFGATSPTSGGVNYSSIEKITFSNDTATPDTRGNLPSIRAATVGLNTNEYGYVVGGRANTAATTNYVNDATRIEFNNDTSTHVTRSSIVSSPFTYGGSTQNSTYGYLAGGIASPTGLGVSYSNVLRYIFSSDSSAASNRLYLDIARANFSGSAENDDFGWFFGGYDGTLFVPTVASPSTSGTDAFSLVSRMSFSSDTTTTIVRGPIGANKFSGSSVQNQSYAWIAGGLTAHSYLSPSTPAPQYLSTSASSVIRYDFSNDTSSGQTRFSSTTLGSSWNSSVHDNEYGWFIGGIPSSSVDSALPYPSPSPPSLPLFDNLLPMPTSSLVMRMIFSNDTAVVSSRGSLNQARRNGSGINGINT